MKYPLINKQQHREVNIPELSGGLNLRDGVTGVRDNQLTDCVNMWYKDGMLRTRPALVSSTSRIKRVANVNEDEKTSTRFHNDILVEYDGFKCVCASNKRVFKTGNGDKRCIIEFEFQAAEKIFELPSITEINGGDEITYFLTEMSGLLYCYVSDYSIWRLEYNSLSYTESAWVRVEEEDMYVPTVLVHAMPISGGYLHTGTLFEGYNLLTSRYKMIFSTYNINDESHNMRYHLATPIPLDVAGTITAKITHSDGTVKTHTVKWEGSGENTTYFEDVDQGDGLWMFVNPVYVMFSSEKGSATIKTLTEEDFVEDNLEITSFYARSEGELKKIFSMTRCIWFGGAANGINGGLRLFLCGNTNDKEKSLVVWSGLNEPLYFGENCYAYVGSKSNAVTTFGRQGENLVIFKENKIYCTYYVQNNDITADDLINQTVVDYNANSVYFPMVLINGFIGCDCPNTVQMCRNRLVWANSEGRVYTLCTMSQYNEHTVYDISEMVAPKLKNYKDKLKMATSADFDGYYILFLDDCAFVADYNSYGYQYIYSYSKTDDANALIPWYFWRFDVFIANDNENDVYENACICTVDDTLLLRAYFDAAINSKAAFVGFTMKKDVYKNCDSVFFDDRISDFLQLDEKEINCIACTKSFEPGGGFYNANIDKIDLKVGLGNTKDVTVNFITEQGEEIHSMRESKQHNFLKDIGFIKTKSIRPCMHSILRVVIKLEYNGLVAIDGIKIGYRLLGGAK